MSKSTDKEKEEAAKNAYADSCVEETSQYIDRILDLLKLGHSRTAAAKTVGMRPTRFHTALKAGLDRPGLANDMLKLVIEAEGHAQIYYEQIVLNDAKDNVRSAQWVLSRRFRLKERHEPTIDVLVSMDMERLKQERLKTKAMEIKLQKLMDGSMEDDDWKSLFESASQHDKKIKSLH